MSTNMNELDNGNFEDVYTARTMLRRERIRNDPKRSSRQPRFEITTKTTYILPDKHSIYNEITKEELK